MAVETVTGLNEILRSHDASSWVRTGALRAPAPAGGAGSFRELLAESIAEVNGLQKSADEAIQKLVTGRSRNLHETMLAVERAEIAFKAMNQVRLKVIEAYREVMRMQV